MKKMLSVALSICMLLSILPTTIFAATMISKSDIAVTAPEAGVAPIVFASVLNQSLEVTKVEWVGELDANGCFKENTAYTINITIRIKAGQDKYLVNQEGGFRVNKKKAVTTSLSEDAQEAVISYTFDNGAGSASVNVPSDATPTEPATAPPTALKDANFYVEAPVQGEKPSTAVTTDRSDLFDISGVKWTGEFDSNGCFIAKNTYRLHFNITVKDGVNVIIPSKGVESIRNYRINGKLLTTGDVIGDGKQLQTGINFEVALPKEAVDMEHNYSQKQANEHYYTVYPAGDVEIIVNEGETLTDKVKGFNVGQTNSVKRIVLNYTYNTHKDWYGSDEVLVGKAWDAAEFQSFPNLEELWIGPKVDIVDFLQDYNASYNDSNDLTMPFNSNNSETQNLTMFVSDTVLPSGFTGDWNRVKNPIGSDGYITINTGPFRRFQSRLYSGADVMQAYKKGASNAREWCTNHDFSELSYTADRVCIMKSCKDIVTYYYSCSKCGKCEYNPNHTGLVKLPTIYSFEMDRMPGDHKCEERNLSDKYFVGVNSRGERVYWKSCVMCAKHPGEALYEDHVPTPAEWVCENATITKDSVEAFAVRNERYVTAKMSEWAQNDVQWASQNGILDLSLLGNDYTKPITRLQFASIAVKLAEVLTGKTIAPADAGIFTDTDNEYVLKAYAAGITSGTSATTFDPNGTLTREQMATFVHRALMYVKNNSKIRYTPYESKLASFSDSPSISSWANEPLGFMNALGLIKGKSDTAIDPQGTCTIQEAILVAQRSMKADEIGYYQVILPDEQNLAGWKSGTNGKVFLPTSNHKYMLAQHSYALGDRIWVTGPKVGSTLPVTDRYTGQTIWAFYEDFKPIRELTEDDIYAYEYYNKNNLEKFKPFVAPEYKGTK